jgi:hypothetical protein
MSSPPSIDDFKAELARLTTAFHKNIAHLKSDPYDESALRNDYLNPLWRALGWDVENVQGATQPLREVQIESRVDIAGRKKRADYLFRTDGIDRFVCEAKKPREDLSRKAAYQAQRYAFNLKLLIASLTNFENLLLYVVGGKPDQDAPWEMCRGWHYTEYVSKAQELWDLFARQNVGTGNDVLRRNFLTNSLVAPDVGAMVIVDVVDVIHRSRPFGVVLVGDLECIFSAIAILHEVILMRKQIHDDNSEFTHRRLQFHAHSSFSPCLRQQIYAIYAPFFWAAHRAFINDDNFFLMAALIGFRPVDFFR